MNSRDLYVELLGEIQPTAETYPPTTAERDVYDLTVREWLCRELTEELSARVYMTYAVQTRRLDAIKTFLQRKPIGLCS